MSHKQKGSLYVVVVFVLVVMGFLATTLTRIQWSDNDAHAKEVLGTQAWLMAQSVNEEMLTLFYPLNSSDSQVGSVCTTLPKSELVNNDMKFDTKMNCRLVESSCRQVGELDEMKYYQLLARVSCGSGVSEVERTEEIWVRE